MIHDKDYMIRMVRQFSNFLAKLLTSKNEGEEEESIMAFDTQMRDIFKMSFDELSSKTSEEIIAIVQEHEDHHQGDFYELLGHLFYHHLVKHDPQNKDYAQKSKTFYELWIQKSSIFSLPIMSRINELNGIINA